MICFDESCKQRGHIITINEFNHHKKCQNQRILAMPEIQSNIHQTIHNFNTIFDSISESDMKQQFLEIIQDAQSSLSNEFENIKTAYTNILNNFWSQVNIQKQNINLLKKYEDNKEVLQNFDIFHEYLFTGDSIQKDFYNQMNKIQLFDSLFKHKLKWRIDIIMHQIKYINGVMKNIASIEPKKLSRDILFHETLLITDRELVLQYPNGNKYKEAYNYDKKNEEGIFVYANGKSFECQTNSDHFIAKGLIKKGFEDSYEGELKIEWNQQEALPHGYGVFTSQNEDIYIGHWVDGMREGQGMQKSTNGEEYEGEWFKDQMHGHGKLTYPNGDCFTGEFKEGLKNGKGIFEDINSNEKYEAEYENDIIKNNPIQFYFNDGRVYYGSMRHQVPDGYGVMKWQKGDIYKGEYKDGKQHGKGLYFYPDGAKYVGDWFNDKKHGSAIYFFPDGAKYNGDWEGDIMNGQGTFIRADGTEFQGEWIEGKLNGKTLIDLDDL